MVDDLSAEERIERFLEESRGYSYPEDAATIRKRYKDTALTLFKESLDDGSPRNYLTFGSRRSSTVSQYGNTPIVIRRSRSSNGELATVVEQVPNLRGRASKSNYTLVEAREKENHVEGDTDTDDDTDLRESKFNSDESFAVREINAKDSESNVSGTRVHEAAPAGKSGNQASTHPQETTLTPGEPLSQDHDNRKSFSHYDLPLQRHKRSNTSETEEGRSLSTDRIHEEPHVHTTSDIKQAIGEVSKVPSCNGNQVPDDSAHKGATSPTSKNVAKHGISEHEEIIHLEESKGSIIPSLENHTDPTPAEVDHEAILREYVQRPLPRSRSLAHSADETAPSEEKSTSIFKLVELKIIESSDNLAEQANRETSVPDTPKSLTTSDIPNLGDDNDDVVFIDASSPSLSRTRFSGESSSGSSEMLLGQGGGRSVSEEAVGIPAKRATNPQPSPVSKSPTCVDTGKADSAKPRKSETHTGLRDLPIRSPTPPKRRPQRSPRTPKLREKTRQRHSSLALTSDEEVQEPLSNGTRSASPLSKGRESRFFSFSLKKETSKSATSLTSRRGREKVMLSSLKLQLEDPGVVNPQLVPSPSKGEHCDSSGKRVGIRSMVIDGTIKRNFIVIHPSDNSDTIGLAPVSPTARQGEPASLSTPEALSTVKTRLTTLSTERLDSVKRISCQGELKEELSDIPENIKDFSGSHRGSLNFGQLSRSLRTKHKKTWDHKPLRSSHSLPGSEPAFSSPSGSQTLYKSPSSLSEVDCDSHSVLAQRLHDKTSPRTVSKMCVVM